MSPERVNQFLMTLSSKIPPESIPMVRERLLQSNMDEMMFLSMTSQLKDSTISLILSICLGYWGVDRFFIGDIGLGLGKLLTGGGCGIWYLIDIFMIMDATRKKNLEKLMFQLNYNAM